jgi:hypothetical protein
VLTLDLDLNPRVRDIIKAALKEAKPVWVGILSGPKEVWERRALWMIAIGPNHFENGNRVSWECSERVTADGATLSTTKYGVAFCVAPLTTACDVRPMDALVIAEGGIVFTGTIPWQ